MAAVQLLVFQPLPNQPLPAGAGVTAPGAHAAGRAFGAQLAGALAAGKPAGGTAAAVNGQAGGDDIDASLAAIMLDSGDGDVDAQIAELEVIAESLASETDEVPADSFPAESFAYILPPSATASTSPPAQFPSGIPAEQGAEGTESPASTSAVSSGAPVHGAADALPGVLSPTADSTRGGGRNSVAPGSSPSAHPQATTGTANGNTETGPAGAPAAPWAETGTATSGTATASSEGVPAPSAPAANMPHPEAHRNSRRGGSAPSGLAAGLSGEPAPSSQPHGNASLATGTLPEAETGGDPESLPANSVAEISPASPEASIAPAMGEGASEPSPEGQVPSTSLEEAPEADEPVLQGSKKGLRPGDTADGPQSAAPSAKSDSESSAASSRTNGVSAESSAGLAEQTPLEGELPAGSEMSAGGAIRTPSNSDLMDLLTPATRRESSKVAVAAASAEQQRDATARRGRADLAGSATPAGLADSLRQLPTGTPAAGNVENVSTSSTVSPHAVVDQVRAAVVTAHQEQRQLRVRLNPPELGPLQVEVHQKDGVITARLEAQSAATHRLILENLPQLRESLAQQGLNVDRIDSSHNEHMASQQDSRFSHSSSQQQEHSRDWQEPLPNARQNIVSTRGRPAAPERPSTPQKLTGLDVKI